MSSTCASAILVEVTRGAFVESRHRGHIAVLNPNGEIVGQIGDLKSTTHFRSAAKPFQALPLVLTGAADHFQLTAQELAVINGSHSGESVHLQTVQSILDKIGLAESALQCGAHLPFDEATAKQLRATGQSPSVLHNNCSGKHSGMLALAKFLGHPLDNYLDPEHPIQRLIRQTLAQFTADFELLTRRPGLLGQKGAYWAGMTELRLGQKAAAIARFRHLVESHPFTFYSQLARLRLREQGVQIGPFGDSAASESAEGLTPWPDKPDTALLSDSRLQRVTELLDIELRWEAAQELRRVESAVMHEYTSARALPTLIGLYTRGEQFQRPHLLAEVHGASALRRDPYRVPQARPFWEAKYPLAYRSLVERFTPTGKNPPRYLYAIMQKESAYNPQDISTADAIGLLQMIPPTSRRVAKFVGRPYTDDILYDPEGNIQFGAWYIGHLLQKFKAQVPLGAGSFNAGPKAMMRWLDKNGDRALDEFIELCPYRETREYMKKLLDIYAHYVYLWDRQDYLPSLVVDRKYLTPADDGIDY